MANPIIRGFSKLTQFSGRDTRGEFWPYVGAVFVLTFTLNAILTSWTVSQMFADLQSYAAAHPESVTTTVSPGGYSVRVEEAAPAGMPMPDFTLLFGCMIAFVLLNIALLAAAVSRRLHDRSKSPFWGLLPVPFLLGGVIGMQQLMVPAMNGGVPDFGLFGLLFLNNIAYLVALVTLIIMLAQPGVPGANRHGEGRAAPVRPIEDWSTPG